MLVRALANLQWYTSGGTDLQGCTEPLEPPPLHCQLSGEGEEGKEWREWDMTKHTFPIMSAISGCWGICRFEKTVPVWHNRYKMA